MPRKPYRVKSFNRIFVCGYFVAYSIDNFVRVIGESVEVFSVVVFVANSLVESTVEHCSMRQLVIRWIGVNQLTSWK